MQKKILTLIISLTFAALLLSGCHSATPNAEPAVSVETAAPDAIQEPDLASTKQESLPEEPEIVASPAKEPVPEETPAPTAEPTPEASPEASPETTPDQMPAYTYTELSTAMYATKTVNVRDLPSTDGTKVGGLSPNQEVQVTGQCKETSWYRIDYDGNTAYVSNKYLSSEKLDLSQQTETTTKTASSGNWADGYELHTWYDMGEYFFYIGTDLEDAVINGLNPQAIFVSIGVYAPNTYGGILQARYPDRMITSVSTAAIPGKSGVMYCAVYEESNGFPDWDSVDWLWGSSWE